MTKCDHILPILQVHRGTLGILHPKVHPKDAQGLRRGRTKDAADSAHARGLSEDGLGLE